MADSVGNRLGRRAVFVYQTDSGTAFNMRLDESVALGVGNDRSTDATRAALPASQSFPIRPRYVLLSLNSDPQVTKRAIVGDVDGALWTAEGGTQVIINAVTWTVTARVGERRSTLRLVPAIDPG